MAEAEQKTPQSAESGEPAAPPPKKRSIMTIGLVGGVMIVEGVAIFACMKMFGSHPDPTQGMEPAPTTNPWAEFAEVEVASLRVPNSKGARTTLYSVKIVVTVPHDRADEFKEILTKRKWTIEDAISQVIQEANEVVLNEPGKETLKRKVRHELGMITHDDKMIEDVIIPTLIALPTGL